MQHLYVDQVQKLDVHSLMTKAVSKVRADSYALTVAMEKWPQIQGQPDSNLLAIEVKLDRSTDVPATDPISGGMVLKFTMPDGRKCEQWVQIVGVPSGKRGRRWKVAWPCGERAQTLYFKHTTEQFDSRKSLGLKYRTGLKSRRRLSRKGHPSLVRMRLYLRELEAKNPDPYIPKPLWMTEDRYQFLLGGITKEYIRFMSPVLGVPLMEFYDEYVEPDVNAMPEQLPLRDPQSLAMCYLDRAGKLQIKAKYERKYGLPKGAAPDTLTHVWFGFFNDEATAA